MAEDHHSVKLRGVRGIDDETWNTFGEVTAAIGTDRSAVTRDLIMWWLGLIEQPPPRPDRTRVHGF